MKKRGLLILLGCMICLSGCSPKEELAETIETIGSGAEITEEYTEEVPEPAAPTPPVDAEQEEESEDRTFSLGDVDENGQPEYAVMPAEDPLETDLYFNGEKIYTYRCDFSRCNPLSLFYEDIDHDGGKELIFTVTPWLMAVEGMSYAVLKHTESGWTELAVYQSDDEEKVRSEFPISITKGKGDTAVIACEGLKKKLEIDVGEIRRFHREAAVREKVDVYGNVYNRHSLYYYAEIFPGLKQGEACADISAYSGLWLISVSEFQGSPCLTAHHDIGSWGRSDFGAVNVYYDYDTNGKIRLLDLQYVTLDQEREDFFSKVKWEESEYKADTFEASYESIFQTYRKAGEVMRETGDIEKARAEAECSDIFTPYLTAIQNPDAVLTPLFYDLDRNGTDELFIGIRYENGEETTFQVYDIYTWKDGRAYRLMRDAGEANEIYEIMEDGILRVHYLCVSEDQSRTTEAYLYYQLPEGATELKPVDAIYAFTFRDGRELFDNLYRRGFTKEKFEKKAKQEPLKIQD